MPARRNIRNRFARQLGPWCWSLAATLALGAPLPVLILTDTPAATVGRLVEASFSDPPSPGARPATDCTTCHAFDPLFSHPVNIRPARSMPDHFPLQDGRLACTTCHDDGALQGHETRAPRGNPMIRSDSPGPSVCTECHQRGQPGPAGAHASGLTFAHLPKGSRAPQPASKGSALDAESRDCMACHDGSAAADAGLHTGTRTALVPERDHPVGIPYKAQPGRHDADDVRLVELHKLDKRIRLFDGQVGCGSCHSVYAKQSNLLVMPTLRSQLCYGCHIE
jgi:predicted CXXCH cytochrome family protein